MKVYCAKRVLLLLGVKTPFRAIYNLYFSMTYILQKKKERKKFESHKIRTRRRASTTTTTITLLPTYLINRRSRFLPRVAARPITGA